MPELHHIKAKIMTTDGEYIVEGNVKPLDGDVSNCTKFEWVPNKDGELFRFYKSKEEET